WSERPYKKTEKNKKLNIMKKLLKIIIILLVTIPTIQAQKINILKASDTVNTKNIIVPDYALNESFNIDDQKLAIIKGKQLISAHKTLEYENFHSYTRETTKTLVYEKGKKIFPETTISDSEKSLAWITMIIVIILYGVFMYIINICDETLDAAAFAAFAAVFALAVAFDAAVALAALAAFAALSVADFAAYVAADYIYVKKVFLYTYVSVTIIGLTIVAYYFTPLFLVMSVFGMLGGYFVHRIVPKK
ncbi:MAG: hypothetical protein LR005_02300, partial [Candidatus Pacebacteria bacterium]|nr:hypothetical protein [Candidatus Paceibacterota bacterium]